jgi:hypothetical protein
MEAGEWGCINKEKTKKKLKCQSEIPYVVNPLKCKENYIPRATKMESFAACIEHAAKNTMRTCLNCKK